MNNFKGIESLASLSTMKKVFLGPLSATALIIPKPVKRTRWSLYRYTNSGGVSISNERDLTFRCGEIALTTVPGSRSASTFPRSNVISSNGRIMIDSTYAIDVRRNLKYCALRAKVRLLCAVKLRSNTRRIYSFH